MDRHENAGRCCRLLARRVLRYEPSAGPADVERLAAFLGSVVEDWIEQEKLTCSVCGEPYLGHDHLDCARTGAGEWQMMAGGPLAAAIKS